APKGVPQPILDALTDALDKALDDEHLRKRFSDLGGDIPGKERRGQQPLAVLVKSEIARWTPIIKAANGTIGGGPPRTFHKSRLAKSAAFGRATRMHTGSGVMTSAALMASPPHLNFAHI